jgi:hypothetical protein
MRTGEQKIGEKNRRILKRWGRRSLHGDREYGRIKKS